MSEKSWSTDPCREQDEGGLHEPRVLYACRVISPAQTFVELVVACKYCGEKGLLELPLVTAQVTPLLSVSPPTGELLDLCLQVKKSMEGVKNAELQKRAAALVGPISELRAIHDLVRRGCCGRPAVRMDGKCSDCPL